MTKRLNKKEAAIVQDKLIKIRKVHDELARRGVPIRNIVSVIAYKTEISEVDVRNLLVKALEHYK